MRKSYQCEVVGIAGVGCALQCARIVVYAYELSLVVQQGRTVVFLGCGGGEHAVVVFLHKLFHLAYAGFYWVARLGRYHHPCGCVCINGRRKWGSGGFCAYLELRQIVYLVGTEHCFHIVFLPVVVDYYGFGCSCEWLPRADADTVGRNEDTVRGGEDRAFSVESGKREGGVGSLLHC